MRRITPFLWFDGKAEEAMNFYVSIFENSRILGVSRGPDGNATSVTFELDGQPFMAFNAGPEFKFNEAISLFVHCETQDEVDEYWAKLSAGGGEGQCGWLKDRYGLWWQVIPSVLGELMNNKDAEKAGRVTQAMLQMKKIDIAALRRAYDNR